MSERLKKNQNTNRKKAPRTINTEETQTWDYVRSFQAKN